MSKSSTNLTQWIVWIIVGIVLVTFMRFGSAPKTPIPLATPQTPVPAAKPTTAEADPATRAQQILTERKSLDKSLWVDEVAAQEYESPFVQLWDRLRSGTNDVDTFAGLNFQTMTHAPPGVAEELEHGITRQKAGTTSQPKSIAEFITWLRGFERRGFTLKQSEWHHGRFVPASETNSAQSVFNITLHVTGPGSARYVLSGTLAVDWTPDSTPPQPAALRLEKYELLTRTGALPFAEIKLPITDKVVSHPTLVHDLNDDGFSEIVLPAQNLYFENLGGMKFERRDLLRAAPKGMSGMDLSIALPLSATVLDEFTGDGMLDFIIAIPKFGVYLYRGASDGFSVAPERIFAAESMSGSARQSDLRYPTVITSGDVDGNGTTDLWIGQYKESMFNGEIPNPIFDANSGHPAFLLLNQGAGRFVDGTVAAGLTERRHRWTYTGSLWDFDQDGDLDLLTVNDFSGVDAYSNDGKGHFKMVTDRFVDERANFGMGHTIADLNRDGELDLYVTGMSSTTARRLESLGLRREGFPEIDELRMRMAFGNRLYVGDGKGSYRQPAFAPEVARSGWAWGVGTIDLENDGFPELYVANGHRSGKSCKDYCTEFWTHDVYLDSRLPTATTLKVFEEIKSDWGGNDSSWNGFEKNVLYLNRGGTNFVNAAFLFGMAFEHDSRAVIIEDLDRDGRQDLLFMQLDSNAERPTDILHCYQNRWEQTGNWIGITLKRHAGSIYGARVVVESANVDYPAVFVNGDSFYSQHSATKHFGLGTLDKVTRVRITWPDGKETTLNDPKINQYHRLVQDAER